MASSYLHRPCYDVPTIRPFILVSLCWNYIDTNCALFAVYCCYPRVPRGLELFKIRYYSSHYSGWNRACFCTCSMVNRWAYSMIILALISNVRGTAMEARHERRFTTNRPPLNLTIVHFGSLEPLKPGDTINPVAIILPNSVARSDPLVIFLGSLEFYYSSPPQSLRNPRYFLRFLHNDIYIIYPCSSTEFLIYP